MATRFSGQDIGLFTTGGIALASTGTQFSFEIANEKQDAGLVSRLGKNSQPVKAAGKLSVSLNSVISGSNRVSHSNVTAFTIGGTNYLPVLKSYSLSGSYEHRMQAAIGDKYVKPQVVAKDYQIAVALDVQNVDSYTLMNLMGGTDFTNVAKAVSITINSVAITIASNLNQGTVKAQRYDLQELALSFDGADPSTGAFPAAPTGTTTILEKALNAPTTEIAFAFQNAVAGNTNGMNARGNCGFESFSFEVQDGQLVNETYNFATYGAITIAASS